jgi:hypothetical protein
MKKLVLCLSALAVAGAISAQTKWDLPTGYSANSFQTQNVQQFANEVDQLTGGKLKITLHPGGSLYKANEIKRAVQTGQVPAAEFILSGAANENPLFGVDSIPVPGHKLCGVEASVPGRQAGAGQAARFAGHEGAVLRALGPASRCIPSSPSTRPQTLPVPRCAPTTRRPRALRSCSRPSR